MVHPLQTKQWGEFRSEWGNIIENYKNGIIVFSKVPYLPLTIGTVIKGQKPTKLDILEITKIATQNKAIFVKLEPNVLYDQKLEVELVSWGLVKGKTLFTPTSFWIDLTKSEEELLKSFSSKTRYNIRLAQKHGVIVKIDNSDKAFDKYLDLTFETAKRQGFYAHTPNYHKLMWKYLKGSIAHLLTATYNKEVVSAWILFAHDGFLYYPYGASTDKYKEVMANNLMMWEAIRFGKSLGLKTFDLWGREEGKGFTKFKEGYNPKVVEFIGSWDLIIDKPLYYLYKTAEKLRWFLLRLKAKL